MDVDAEARQILGEAALADRSSLIGDAAEYVHRTRLGRRCGLIGGLVLGFGPLAADSHLSLVLPRMFAGYVAGLLVSELLAPRRERPARRAADLRVRRVTGMLPRWAQATVWAVFVPALACPLLSLVHPARGLTHVSRYGYYCASGSPPWPGLAVLTASAAIGAAGLLIAQLTLGQLARRPRPADDLERAHLDDVLRGMSARAVAGGAVALALALAAAISQAVNAGAHVLLCPAQPGMPVPAYPWAATLTPWLPQAPVVLLAAAFLVLAVCRRPQRPRRRAVPGAAR